MKPITYWLQNDAINQLVEKYGAHLEKLSPDSRRDLISSLAADRASYLWEDGVLIANLTRYEKDLLIEAIAASLTHHGNPWLETARATVAIAQKEGTSSH
jgi:hypothetical protein